MTNQQTTRQRFAAVIPVFVAAGCPEPRLLERYVNRDGTPEYILAVGYYEWQPEFEEVIISVLKEWFREKVGVHFQPNMYELDTPYQVDQEDGWFWNVNQYSGWHPDPTEAYLQCAEALARVIGGKG